MKKIIFYIKWIFSKSKPILVYLFLSVIIGSIVSLCSVRRSIVSKSLIDSATTGDSRGIINWLIILALIIFGSILLEALNNLLSTYCSTRLSNNIQKKIYGHLSESEWLELSKYHSVNLLTRLNTDVSTVTSTVVSTIPSVISLLVMLVSSFFALMSLDTTMAVIAIIIFPLCGILGKFFSQRLKKIYIQSQDQDVKYKSFIQETLQNNIIVKSFCMENFNIVKLDNLQQEKLSLQIKSSILSSFAGLFLALGGGLGYFLTFLWGASNLSKGITTFGTMTAMLQLFSSIQAPIYALASYIPQSIRSFASIDRLLELENIPSEQTTFGNIDSSPSDIKIDNVTFKYNSTSTVLKNLSLDISNGETVALVGPSGQGKTTIIRLLLSLIHPTKGNIYIYNKNKLESINKKHRELISYIPQGNTLISGTIKENLLYGNNHASDQEIKNACKLACAWDFIDKLDNKLDTFIGEKGLGLSEGQAQRLSIARAFLREKPILILDEATSALDPETEVSILKAVKNLEHNPTCIIITHRPTALEICDKIYMIKNGKSSIINKNYVKEVACDLI